MKNYKNFKNKKVLITGYNGFKGTVAYIIIIRSKYYRNILKNKTKGITTII